MADDSQDDLYALLGIAPDADEAQLRRAFRKLALRWHPDRAGAKATGVFQLLSAAYTVLSDPAARAAYDRRRGVRTDHGKSAPHAAPRRAPGKMLRRLSGPLNALLACGVARYAAPDVLELLLNADEAAQGGMVSISLRVPVHCPRCAADRASACTRCGGARVVEELFSAWLAVPPGVDDGALLPPSALLPGMVRPVSFRVRRPAAP